MKMERKSVNGRRCEREEFGNTMQKKKEKGTGNKNSDKKRPTTIYIVGT